MVILIANPGTKDGWFKEAWDGQWGDWECPECGVTEYDPEGITGTTCRNGHAVVLGRVEHQLPSIGRPVAFRQAWLDTPEPRVMGRDGIGKTEGEQAY